MMASRVGPVFTAEPFDLLSLLDLVMPEKDGFTVLRSCKEKRPPSLCYTNLGQEEDAQRCKDLGADDYFGEGRDTPARDDCRADNTPL